MSHLGTLYLVATPIGNMGDITRRAIEILSTVTLVAAEDTRRTGLLLQKLGVQNKLLRCDEQALEQASKKIIAHLQSGQSAALVTDAGTPCVADPGDRLVRACREAGLTVQAIPGASSVLAGLTVSGYPGTPFTFYGFLPKKGKVRNQILKSLQTLPHTAVLFESPHRILKTLPLLHDLLGSSRRVCVCKELTKLFETSTEGPLGELVTHFQNVPSIKGEYTLVIQGVPEQKKSDRILEDE